MSDIQTPDNFKDLAQLLTADGITTSNVWYHGTASGLVASIQEKGLKRSGDAEVKALEKKTMTTIGGSYKESKEPLYLTQSKELAYFWATETTRIRSVRTGTAETPAIIEVTLDDTLNQQVKTDVGAAAMIMSGSSDYPEYIEALYKEYGHDFKEVDPMAADRMVYMTQLGLAYINKDIRNPIIKVLKA